MCGFIAQLVEHRTGTAEVTGSNPVEALIFFRLLLSNCLNWKIYCDDHISLSSTTVVQIWIISYKLHNVYPISAFIACIKKFSFVLGSPRTYLSRNQCKITWLSNYRCPIWTFSNRPFQSSLVPLFQNESKCETFHMKMSSACSFIFMQIKIIFITMVSHLDSLWNRGARELGNGLLDTHVIFTSITRALWWLPWQCFYSLFSKLLCAPELSWTYKTTAVLGHATAGQIHRRQ